MPLCYNKFGDSMKEKVKTLKYTIIVVVMFFIGIMIGIAISTIKNSKEETKIPAVKNFISKEEVKQIALEDAKRDFKKEVSLDTDIYVELEKENGMDVYEVTFYLGGVYYEYKITPLDGKIIDKDMELPTNQNSGTNTSDNANSLNKGKVVVLKDNSLKENEVTFTKQKQELDNGKTVFEFQFFTQSKEYEYKVDVATLKILEKEVELKNKVVSGNKSITQEEAKAIALKDAKLTEQEVIMKKIELENELNYKVYEVDFYKDNQEYDYEIDVASGTILKFSWKLR